MTEPTLVVPRSVRGSGGHRSHQAARRAFSTWLADLSDIQLCHDSLSFTLLIYIENREIIGITKNSNNLIECRQI